MAEEKFREAWSGIGGGVGAKGEGILAEGIDHKDDEDHGGGDRPGDLDTCIAADLDGVRVPWLAAETDERDHDEPGDQRLDGDGHPEHDPPDAIDQVRGFAGGIEL